MASYFSWKIWIHPDCFKMTKSFSSRVGQTDVRDDSKKNRKKIDQCSKPWLIVLYRGLYSTLMGIVINQYNDPYEPTSTMKRKRVFFMAHMRSTCHCDKSSMLSAVSSCEQSFDLYFFPSKLYKGRGFSHCFFKWKKRMQTLMFEKIHSIHPFSLCLVRLLSHPGVIKCLHFFWYQKHGLFVFFSALRKPLVAS